MRILVVSNLYPPCALGGYEKLCFKITELLKSKGHEIHVLTSTFGGKKKQNEIKSAPGEANIIRRLKLFVGDEENIYAPCNFSEAEFWATYHHNIDTFRIAYAKIKPEIVFVWNLYFLHNSLICELDKISEKAVYFLSDNWLREMCATELFKKISAKLKIGASVVNRILNFAGRGISFNGSAIYSSRFMADLYRQSGINFHNETIVYNGVELDGYKTNKRRYSIGRTAKLLFAGRVVSLKGVHILIEALNLLINKLGVDNIHLDIVGDTSDVSYVSEIKKSVNSNKLDRYIDFIPPVSESELLNLFNQHDIFIFPSIYEPFSLTLILGLASGIPTIGSNAGGNIEVLGNKFNALTYPKNNAKALAKKIFTLLNDEALRAKIGINGNITATQYNISGMVSRIEEFLSKN